ncbi:aldo/keto reductase [Phycicoccus sp. Soil802]|uniref:aldo/keto reductase n=1 Tax=Phycicoccus sp. Soil802 TaxID=1736414 RepID=UPI000702E48C|nr:aldo/keto reductase [Phycicoccus sp. Soil802]KRF27270.1 oxidoreductase [Phycicoccus sp. Soil802]
MKYRTIGTQPARQREVSVLALGAMWFGTATDEPTAYALLDRFAEAGGTFVDTSNNYAFWANGTQGGESEALLGRWLASSGKRDSMVVATKVGARPLAPARDFRSIEGLSPAVVREQVDRSRDRLGIEQIDLYYAHLRDPGTPLADQVDGLAGLVEDGAVGMLGASNFWAWELERSRSLAGGRPSYDVVQFQHSYLRPRTDQPGLASPEGTVGVADGAVLSWLADDPSLSLVAYSPLLKGAYTRADKPLPESFDHPGTPARLAVLDEVARQTGATRNQVVLAWMLGAPVPAIPLVGASAVAQLDESIEAVDLELTAEQQAMLDGERERVW